MITKSGTRPVKRVPRRKFHRNFGSTSVSSIPDFNLDSGLWTPDQNADGAPTECVGYTVAEIITDIKKKIQSPDFGYAGSLWLEGNGPSVNGVDFHLGLESAVVVGSIDIDQSLIRASNKGELFVSDINNYSDSLRKLALTNVQNGVFDVLGNGDHFDSILSALYTGQVGISIGTPWFPQWEQATISGMLPPVFDLSKVDSLPWHNWVVKGKKTVNGTAFLVAKTHQGKGYGDNGFTLYDRDTINRVLSIPGTGAMTLSLNASRWFSLASIALQHYKTIPFILPQMITLSQKKSL